MNCLPSFSGLSITSGYQNYYELPLSFTLSKIGSPAFSSNWHLAVCRNCSGKIVFHVKIATNLGHVTIYLTCSYLETRKRVIGKQYRADQRPHYVTFDQGLHCLLTGFFT